MATDSTNTTVEGFVIDSGFVDQSKSINNILIDEGGTVASLTPRALSYFSTPAIFTDKRLPTARSVNWAAESVPQVVIDKEAFETFVNVVNNLPGPTPVGFFKLIDKLFFNRKSTDTNAILEAALLADADIAAIYVPGSFSVSTILVSDKVYLKNSVITVETPSLINFSIKLATGTTTTTFVMKLYTSIDAWLKGYNVSKIVETIPPLPYDKIYNDSLVTTTDNIFATASLTATLSYTTIKPSIGAVSISGTVEYRAVVTDGVDSLILPFNLLYKGRPPTLFEIRKAIKAELLTSGISDEAGWKKRIPGVFVDGRFYIIPLWDQTFTKADQIVYPNIARYKDYKTITHKIISSLGYGDVTENTDVLSLYYNNMTATVVPDMSGTIAIQHLGDFIPDYQDYSPTDEQYAYMQENTRLFIREINTIMAVDSGAITSNVFTPNTEGLLTFYSFTVGSYEMCLITKLCYDTIMGSIQ